MSISLLEHIPDRAAHNAPLAARLRNAIPWKRRLGAAGAHGRHRPDRQAQHLRRFLGRQDRIRIWQATRHSLTERGDAEESGGAFRHAV
jgi:hypothetical protein